MVICEKHVQRTISTELNIVFTCSKTIGPCLSCQVSIQSENAMKPSWQLNNSPLNNHRSCSIDSDLENNDNHWDHWSSILENNSRSLRKLYILYRKEFMIIIHISLFLVSGSNSGRTTLYFEVCFYWKQKPKPHYLFAILM